MHHGFVQIRGSRELGACRFPSGDNSRVLTGTHSRAWCAGDGHGAYESRVAGQLIHGLFHVGPGEQVVIRGGPRYLPIMEAIAIEVLATGGKAHILTTTDGERRYRAERLPLQHLGLPPSSIDSALILQSDLEINLPYDSDFRSIWPDLGSERFKRHQRSNPILSALNERSTRRYLYLAMPSQAEVVAAIRGVGLDSSTYTALWWRAATANIDSMAARGASVSGFSVPGRFASPPPTELTLHSHRAIVRCMLMWQPCRG